jgi:2,4-didehydro-3-deoxy-L-rhamnonate hydrolase
MTAEAPVWKKNGYRLRMRLFRYGQPGKESPGVFDLQGEARDVSAFARDYDEGFFESGGLEELAATLETDAHLWPRVNLSEVRLGSPVARPSKILGIGLNYTDHAVETGSALPSEPKIFMKATSALCGVYDDLILPRGSEQTDYEVELAFVIGRRANYVTRADALDYVAGFTVCNDFSERDFQKNRSGQFVKGKSADTFAPLGPFLVTKEELTFSDTRLWCKVNGEMRQEDRTSNMIFDVPSLVETLSQYMSLLPGDVITTGTPAGVALGMQPPRFLREGDIVTYGVEGIGEGRQVVSAHRL